MSVKIKIHSLLIEFTENNEVVEVEGSTVGECLDQLVLKFPAIKEKIFKKEGVLLNTTEILVNGEDPYPDDLAEPVRDGDEVYIIMMFGCVG